MNSRTKGKVGELEFAAFLRAHGFEDARRGIQFKGGPDSPDVIGLLGVHVERKRTEKLALIPALDQAIRDSGADNVPVVAWRCNKPRTGPRGVSVKGEEIVIMRTEDWLPMYAAWRRDDGK